MLRRHVCSKKMKLVLKISSIHRSAKQILLKLVGYYYNEENELKNYFLRFFLISQMDFKFSLFEMVMLLINPKKAYHFHIVKNEKEN